VSIWLWILLGVVYLTALVVLGLATLRKGHTALFWFGILFPFLWIVGALMQPTPAAAAAEARTNLR
jgi:purine-cytosine permease-like protein